MNLNDWKKLDKFPKPHSKKDPWLRYRCNLPETASGLWSIQKYEVKSDLWLMRMMRDGRGTPPGMYTRLYHKSRGVIMSDTNAELMDHNELFIRATGHVLIHGLGLGLALQGVLLNDEVSRVDVVEIDEDVMNMVSPHFNDHRVSFHLDDCRTKKWPRGSSWDVVWHDIWDNICGDNKVEMNRLKSKFRNKCDWQHCWGSEWMHA